jgi:hypothetical protein
MLQLPDAKGGEQEAFGAGKRSDSRQLPRLIIPAGGLPRTASARFGFAGAPCGLADWEMTTIIHNQQKSSF